MLKKKAILILMIMSLGVTSISCSKSKTLENEESPNVEVNETIQTDKSENIYRIFYFNTENQAINYIEKELEGNENQILKDLVDELKLKPADSLLPIASDVEVITTDRNEKEDLLNVYFNKDFITEMALDSSTESGFITSIVNTLGYNFGVSKVAIYMNDEIYTGLKEDTGSEYFNVNYDNCAEYSKESSLEDISIVYYDEFNNLLRKSENTFKVSSENKANYIAQLLTEIESENYISFNDVLQIESVSEDTDTGILYINLANKYYEILKNVGSSGELGALKSIAYTYGLNYGFNKVVINIDGKPYCGSHIEFSPDEFITIDMNSVE